MPAMRASRGSTTQGRARLLSLYQKGKDKQWDAQSRIDWSQDVDPMNPIELPYEFHPLFGSPMWDAADDYVAPRCTSTSRPGGFLAVPARRAGGDGVRGQDRRGRPGPGREVLRGHPDYGRGQARRGVLAVPAVEGRRGLPDQHAPDRTAGGHPPRLPLGHALPRHAGTHRGARAGRLRGAA